MHLDDTVDLIDQSKLTSDEKIALRARVRASVFTYKLCREAGCSPMEALALLYGPRPLPILQRLLRVPTWHPEWSTVRVFLRALSTKRLIPDHPDLHLRARALEAACSHDDSITRVLEASSKALSGPDARQQFAEAFPDLVKGGPLVTTSREDARRLLNDLGLDAVYVDGSITFCPKGHAGLVGRRSRSAQ